MRQHPAQRRSLRPWQAARPRWLTGLAASGEPCRATARASRPARPQRPTRLRVSARASHPRALRVRRATRAHRRWVKRRSPQRRPSRARRRAPPHRPMAHCPLGTAMRSLARPHARAAQDTAIIRSPRDPSSRGRARALSVTRGRSRCPPSLPSRLRTALLARRSRRRWPRGSPPRVLPPRIRRRTLPPSRTQPSHPDPATSAR
jgi:hypothetical protein